MFDKMGSWNNETIDTGEGGVLNFLKLQIFQMKWINSQTLQILEMKMGA